MGGPNGGLGANIGDTFSTPSFGAAPGIQKNASGQVGIDNPAPSTLPTDSVPGYNQTSTDITNFLDSLNTGATSTGTPAAGGAPTTGGAGFWDSILNGITGGQGIAGLGNEIGSAIPFAGIYGAASAAAAKQQAANEKTIAPLMTQAKGFLDEANKQLGLFSSGTLDPGQQAQIDAYAASQKSRIAQQMASQGITDSSAMNSANQQIDNNAMIMKSNFVQQSLSNALSLEGAGIMPLMIAIQDKLVSDTQITNTMTQLMGTLASAWAYQVSQNKAGGGGGGGTGTNSTGGGIIKTLENKGIDAIKNWLTGPSPTSAEIGTPESIQAIASGAPISASALGPPAAFDPAAIPSFDPSISASLGTAAPAAEAFGSAASTASIAAGVPISAAALGVPAAFDAAAIPAFDASISASLGTAPSATAAASAQAAGVGELPAGAAATLDTLGAVAGPAIVAFIAYQIIQGMIEGDLQSQTFGSQTLYGRTQADIDKQAWALGIYKDDTSKNQTRVHG